MSHDGEISQDVESGVVEPLPVLYELEVVYTKPLYKKALSQYLGKELRKFFIVLALLTILLWGVFPVLFEEQLSSPMMWVLFLLPILFLLVPIRCYYEGLKNFDRMVKKMDDPTMGFSMSQAEYMTRCDLSEGRLRWKHFHKLWKFDEVWLLFPNPNSFYILPREVLTPEAAEFLEARLRQEDVEIHPKK